MIHCPIPLQRLVDASAGELTEAEERALEDHVFACDTCGQAYARVHRWVGAMRTTIAPVVSHGRLARLQTAGLRVRLTPVPAGGRVKVHFAADVDLLIHALRGDLSTAQRVDVGLESVEGQLLQSFENVDFDRDSGEVLIACQRHYGEIGFPHELRFRVRVHAEGEVRELGDYVVDHLF